MVRTLNLGVLAHVDAGKTSLTERLLHSAGVIERPGSVDDGDTQTDSLALERQRGITIKSAVVSFVVDDVTVNLIDTPGHPDFIAEVERVLSVLDGAVLVVSGLEGVQAQTRVLMRTLRRLRIPTLVFVNKMDRPTADAARTVRAMAEKLTRSVVPLDDTARLAEVLAEHDDELIESYVDGQVSWVRSALVAQTRRALVHPVFFGSAVSGAGVDELIAGITEFLPAEESSTDGPLSGTVFKVERGAGGEKIAYVRMFSGVLRPRERIDAGKVTALSVFGGGELGSGRIGKVWGLSKVRVGDAVGAPRAGVERHFAPPTLETVVEPRDPSERGLLHSALTQLAEQDPLINLREDFSVSLYGEVQKEVIQATLAAEYCIDVDFRETTTIHIQRPVGVGEAVEVINTDSNPFLATVGLRVEPGPAEFRLEVELGSMPFSFFRAVEESVRSALQRAEVRDCLVTMTRSGYWARQSHAHGSFDKSMSSTAGDFRGLAPVVLLEALRRAGTEVLEPIHRLRLEVPADTLGAVSTALAKLRGVPLVPVLRGAVCELEAEIPAGRVHAFQQALPGLTRGEGVVEAEFDRYVLLR
ncbi:TetM/TetW/TetO/TetS family tetracycline resistance ribosomal protection protein [Allokutzneria multivorans]|uniref:TetM/TetW/TetO/TetS family tetracycline resistance ribosomal protection protein n=1 Tax=Allokutzneria multivorans TaxID=1142134 RepID=A0ABP7T2R5_9PSEU